MVAQFPETITTPAKILLPQIQVDVRTFAELPATRMCIIDIEILNIKKSLAIGTFSRIFAYAQSLANNDINPMPLVNQETITNSSPGFSVTKPETGLVISIDSSELAQICNLSLKINNLRLDYMDEYFNSTLTYLTNAIANDLNP